VTAVNERGLADVDVRGKRVLLREDLNVPLEDGRITDDSRILAAAPTLRALRRPPYQENPHPWLRD